MIRAIMRWLGYVPVADLESVQQHLEICQIINTDLITLLEEAKQQRDAQKQARDARGRFTNSKP